MAAQWDLNNIIRQVVLILWLTGVDIYAVIELSVKEAVVSNLEAITLIVQLHITYNINK